MNRVRLTQSQQSVLAGLERATTNAREQHQREWPNEPTPAGYLFSLGRIVMATNVGRQHRVSERLVLQALRRLVALGLVDVSDTRGIGGATRAWKIAR